MLEVFSVPAMQGLLQMLNTKVTLPAVNTEFFFNGYRSVL